MVNLMAAMTLRNPKRRKTLGTVIGNFTKSYLGRKENYDSYVANMKEARTEPEFTLEELRTEAMEAKVSTPKESIIAIEIYQHDNAAKRLWDKKWQVVVARMTHPS